MCGISGFNFYEPQLVARMNKKIKHRGPDQDGVYLDQNFSLGHTRLSVIDLSERARQPLFNEDKSLVLVFNGEIYNFQELRQELIKKGHRLLSNSDSEVIIHLYEDHGADCLKFFNGIFALAIWDIKKKRLFLARDRIGIKPLYYYCDGSKFIFSSEIKAILEHPIKREMSLEAFNHYFRLHYIPHPLTIFEKIYKLPPAHYLYLTNGRIELKRYWQIDDFENINSKTEIVDQIRFLMKDAVKNQLVSDRPVGVFLSGGIDSTSVLGLVSELGHKQIKTFSVGFDFQDRAIVKDPEKFERKFNTDIEMAKKVSRDYQTEHHSFTMTGYDLLNNLEKVVCHLDEPVANISQTATYLLAKFTKPQVAVVLGGDGGDELFGGYERYYYSYLASRWQRIPAVLRNNVLSRLALGYLGKRLNKQKLLEKLNSSAGVERYLLFMSQKSKTAEEVIQPELWQKNATCGFFQREYFDRDFQNDFEKHFMLTDVGSWLVNESLMRTDKMTMAHGLEERVPILDHRLVELSAKIPSSLKIRNGGKYIFKEAMKKYLPDYVISAPKRGWQSPVSSWLRTELKDFAYTVLSKNYCQATQGLLNFPKVKLMLDDHLSKRRYNLNCLWILLTFQIWAKQNLEK